MSDHSSKDSYIPDEAYNPEDEYTPLDTLTDAADEPAEAPAPAGDEAPADEKAPAADVPAPDAPAAAPAPAVPPQGFAGYPPMYYPYPYCGAPYIQPPAQGAQPVWPAYPVPGQMVMPQQGTYPPMPPFAAYPPQPAPQPAPAPEPEEKDEDKKSAERSGASTGTKVYLIVLTALLLAMIAAFTVYVSVFANKEKDESGNGKTADDPSYSVIAPTFGDPNNNENHNPYYTPGTVEEFDAEITLIEDKGETQKRDSDDPDTVGSPDAKAKGVEFTAQPADKDSGKYTTQSAYDAVSDSVVTVELYEGEITEKSADIKGMGTGTIISADGYLITNAHVIGNSKQYAVRIILNSGKSYRAKVIGYDTWTDLAVLKIDAEGLTPVVFGDSELIEIGQDVIAIGSPGGQKYQNSLTKGVVSALNREISVNKQVRYIQSDATISPGNSGGPLCNIYGQVVGINTAKTVATYYEAMTFSIPSATVKEIVNELLHYGYVRGRARIGFSGNEVAQNEMYYGSPAGILVADIDPAGALADTDIRENDIVTAVDGKSVDTFQDIYAILKEHKAGDKISISVARVE